MWNLVVQFLVTLFVSLLTKPKTDETPRPTESSVDINTNDEVRKVPYFAGTVLYEGSNIIWANDFIAEPITQKVKTGLVSSKRITIAHKINYGVSHAIGWGNIKLKKIYFNDKIGYDSGASSVGEGTYTIDEPRLFNGLDSDTSNGVGGDFDFYEGNDTQSSNTYMTTIQGTSFPNLKGLCYLVFNRFYWGNSSTLPVVKFEVERFPDTVAPAFANINGSANPVEILYEMLTDKEKFGVNVPVEQINLANFASVAEQLYNEGMGISITFDSSTNIDNIKSDIERHINCSIYRDLYTGLWNIKLLRDDFVLGNIKSFDENNIKSFTNFVRPQISNLISEVKVIYRDKNGLYKEKTATAQNNALASLKGDNSQSTTNRYLGITDSSLAQRVAQRDLVAVSNPLITGVIKTNRDAFGLNIGDPIKLSLEEFGLVDTVFRVREIDLGDFKNNEIVLDIIQDAFTFGDPIQDAPDDTGWQPIVDEVIGYEYFAMESPNFFHETNENNDGYNMLFVMSRFNSLARNFQLIVDYPIFGLVSELEILDVSQSTTPFSKLNTGVSIFSSEITIYNGLTGFSTQESILQTESDSSRLLGNNIAYIENASGEGEFISFERAEFDIVGDQWKLKNVWRGLLDTVPRTHDLDSKIWFIDYGNASKGLGFLTYPTDIVNKYNIRGTLLNGTEEDLLIDEPINPTYSVGTTPRYEKPTAPANLKVNGSYYPVSIPLATDMTLTWSHRDRNIIDRILKFDDDTIASEGGVTYTLKIYDDTNTLIKTETGLTGTSYTFTDETTINPLLVHYPQLRVELYSVRGGLESLTMHDFTFTRA